MSPKAVQFKANSIIYFQGDLTERIYILKSGKVTLKSTDIETGQEIQDMIQTGEFFGVKILSWKVSPGGNSPCFEPNRRYRVFCT